jgi:hypothetical protein
MLGKSKSYGARLLVAVVTLTALAATSPLAALASNGGGSTGP